MERRMPLARYFFYVGGVLLALLFIADAYLPKLPVALAGSGGAQRCDLLPLEVENAATTTPKQPGIVSETLDLAQCFPSSQGAPFLARGR
jgi:hypothetical protein